MLLKSTTHRELFVKLLGAEEDELAEGDGERAGQLGEAEGGGIAAEEEIEDELLAGGDAGDERAAVLRKCGRNRVVRALGVIGERLERGTGRGNRRHGRRLGERRDEVEAKLRRLAALMRREEIAHLFAVMLRTRRNLVAARDQLVHHQPDPGHGFLHRLPHYSRDTPFIAPGVYKTNLTSTLQVSYKIVRFAGAGEGENAKTNRIMQ